MSYSRPIEWEIVPNRPACGKGGKDFVPIPGSMSSFNEFARLGLPLLAIRLLQSLGKGQRGFLRNFVRFLTKPLASLVRGLTRILPQPVFEVNRASLGKLFEVATILKHNHFKATAEALTPGRYVIYDEWRHMFHGQAEFTELIKFPFWRAFFDPFPPLVPDVALLHDQYRLHPELRQRFIELLYAANVLRCPYALTPGYKMYIGQREPVDYRTIPSKRAFELVEHGPAVLSDMFLINQVQ